jgi:hypothetical protein
MCKGTVGFIYQNKISLGYNDENSNPDYLGGDVLDLIIRINKEKGWKVFKEHSLNLKNIDTADENMLKKYEKYSSPGNSKIFSDIISTEWLIEMYEGKIQDYIIDNQFIKESLYCEYGYIINLDNMKLEYYLGDQEKPQKNNIFGDASIDGYYPCRLVCNFDILTISEDNYEKIIEKMKRLDETRVDDVEKINLNFNFCIE